MLVKCQYCERQVDKAISVRYKDKNFHKECQILQEQRDKLCAYICELFDLKKPGVLVYTQIKNYIEKYGYTYTGIQKTLYYFYEIKKNSKQNSHQAIGIVPYVYDEAKEFFLKKEEKKQKIVKVIEKHLEKKEEEIVVNQKIITTTKKELSLDDI